jgi:hypothetical protein
MSFQTYGIRVILIMKVLDMLLTSGDTLVQNKRKGIPTWQEGDKEESRDGKGL